MAKIQLTDLVADIRGSVGGVTYTKGVGGIHVRKTKPIPSVSSTSRQTFVRSLCAYLAGLWRTLSEEQRSIWATYAGSHPVVDVFGVPRIYPAYNYFIELNFCHYECDLPIIEDAPIDSEAPISPEGYVEADGDLEGFNLEFWEPTSASYILDVWKFGPASAGRNPQVGDVRHLCYIDPALAETLLDFLCAEGWLTLYVRFLDPDTGLLSPYVNLAKINTGVAL